MWFWHDFNTPAQTEKALHGSQPKKNSLRALVLQLHLVEQNNHGSYLVGNNEAP